MQYTRNIGWIIYIFLCIIPDGYSSFFCSKSVEYTVFHGAEYVLCYLIDSYEGKHWHWLKKTNGVYSLYNDDGLEDLTSRRLPPAIPICYCKIRDNKIIISKNTFCK